jgi:hypothetical protein
MTWPNRFTAVLIVAHWHDAILGVSLVKIMYRYVEMTRLLKSGLDI